MIPNYRIEEIKLFYEIFCMNKENQLSEFNLKERKIKFRQLIKCKYTWILNNEFEEMYSIIKENELEKFINLKKIEIEKKYKEKIIKLFCKLDQNNDLVLNLDEFKIVMYKLNIYNKDEIEKKFKEIDKNNDNLLSIEEFIDFLSKNKNIFDKIEDILNYQSIKYKNFNKNNIIFKDYPNSPDKISKNWTPSLSKLNKSDVIEKMILLNLHNFYNNSNNSNNSK